MNDELDTDIAIDVVEAGSGEVVPRPPHVTVTRSQELLACIAVLADAHPDEIGAALDSLEDDEHKIDVHERSRTRIAIALLSAADDETSWWAESLALSCEPWHRRNPVQHWSKETR